MRNMLFRDMKRGFCSIAYWLCVLALIVMAFISLKVNMRYHPILPVSGALFKKFCKRDFCDEVRDFKIPEPEAVAS